MYNRRLETLIEVFINYNNSKEDNETVISCKSNGRAIGVKCDKVIIDERTYSGGEYTIYKEDFKIFLEKEGYKNILLDELLIASALNEQEIKHHKKIAILVLVFFIALVIVNVTK